VQPLKICLVASEVAPLAKTGGLADVASALPRYLDRSGHEVRVFLPLYASIDLGAYEAHSVDFLRDLTLHLGHRQFGYSVVTIRLPGSELFVHAVDCPELFHRGGIYGEDDEHLRFAFLSCAAIECCQRMGFAPHVFHCNDWHTALLPLYLKTVYAWDGLFEATRTLLTIHNIAYQGIFGSGVLGELSLGDQSELFYAPDLEAGLINFLKTGVLYADLLSTVSPTYAREIQEGELGMGLDELLRQRSESLVGILNGVDTSVWSPATDTLLPHTYSADDMAGKAANKESLLAELSLPRAGSAPLIGIVSRLTAQKGFELLYELLPDLLSRHDLRLVVLGSGAEEYEHFFRELQASFPDRVCFYRGFSEELAHRIEAASDIFLMPSRFEPCGLNQMYSQAYGTVPVVHKTGGLADSVEQWDWEQQTGTGFLFEHFDVEGLRWALESALETYRHPDSWRRLVANGMSRDFSWEHRGEEYVAVYRALAGLD
jgi:starch synthase